MKQATVKWFDDARGFGFLVLDTGAKLGDDVFVHYSVIDVQGHKSLAEGQRVEIELCEGPRGLFAGKVVVLQ